MRRFVRWLLGLDRLERRLDAILAALEYCSVCGGKHDQNAPHISTLYYLDGYDGRD